MNQRIVIHEYNIIVSKPSVELKETMGSLCL